MPMRPPITHERPTPPVETGPGIKHQSAIIDTLPRTGIDPLFKIFSVIHEGDATKGIVEACHPRMRLCNVR